MQLKFRSTILLPAALCLMAWLLAACIKPPEQLGMPTPDPANQEQDVAAIRAALARWLQLDPATIEVVSAERVDWPDSCLGVPDPLALCTPGRFPGYKLVLRANGEAYTLHTAKTMEGIRVAAAPKPQIGAPIITWRGGDNVTGACLEAVIGDAGVGFAKCSLPQIGGKFVTPARQAVLTAFVNQFAAFAAKTPAGEIQFTGRGATIASAAEQQQIAEWAQNVTYEAQAGEPLAWLRYQGPAEMGSPDTSKCAVLQLGTPIEAMLGACDNSATNKDMGKRTYLEWEQIRDRFAPFTHETATEKLEFGGMGTIKGEAWQRALLAWARVKHAELATGQTSATALTAMSWYLGEVSGEKETCRHLTVLASGYAYAEKIPCAGHDVVEATGGWLTNAEMEKFDRWLYQAAPLYVEQNYIDGQGAQALTDEQGDVGIWAMDVWARVVQSARAGDAIQPPAACPSVSADVQLLIDRQLGYCLLYPAGYSALGINVNATEIVSASLMNHVQPRISLVVEDAAGRTLAQVADQLVADYTLPGVKSERSSLTVGGAAAVMLDNLPGADLNRRVVVIQQGRLYSFFVGPLGEQGSATRQEAERLYQQVMDSFRFLDETARAPKPVLAVGKNFRG